MIKSISVQNFKSIINLTLDLGQFNVLIGENGCGKSNILESIAFAAAASSNKLDREFLVSRGLRVTDAVFMKSAFEDAQPEKNILIDIEYKDKESKNPHFDLYYNQESKPPRWEDLERKKLFENLKKRFEDTDFILKPKIDIKVNISEPTDKEETQCSKKTSDSFWFFFIDQPALENYIIYSIEESVLRKFDTETGILPLGKNGEGLFQYLKNLSQTENGRVILQEIKENLSLLDWYDDLEIPQDTLSNDFSLSIKDRYINETLHYFDQRSTNEGFLYLLFYLTLFISDETPSFFAIDNIESSFNPKLCKEITKRLIELAYKHNKQVLLTTHNPYILDGLNIENDEERLFVVRRNLDGHTKINRVEPTSSPSSGFPLSKVWVDGLLGGLPNNF